MNLRMLMAAMLAACTVACGGKDDEEREPVPVVPAATLLVSPQAFTETFDAIGTVVARVGHVATLSAPAAGRVGRVLVASGQAVRAGETLVALDEAPFQSALQAAESAVAAAERERERQQRLAGEGIVPRKDAEAAAADAAAKRADLVNARRVAELSVLRSPISGVVTRMNATLGASVDASQPLVEVADPTALDILLNATPADAGRIRPGAKVSISAGGTTAREAIGVGTVVDIAATIDSARRGVALRVQAPTTSRPLKIGETVFGAVVVATQAAAIVVPNEALVPNGEAFRVFVVDAQGIAHARDVTVGGRSERGTEITAGLAAGERIVTQGAYAVADSARVQLRTPSSAATAATPQGKP